MTEPTVIDIWPGLAPGETTSLGGALNRLYDRSILLDITRPELRIFCAPSDNLKPALLVLPGGGYEFVSYDHEGDKIAEWLNTIGYTAAVLTYRIPNKSDAAFADGQRAMRLLRSRADEFGIDQNRLGAIGFSSGAHLAARLAANTESVTYSPIDDTDSISACPNFAVLIYPAFLIDKNGEPEEKVKPHSGEPPLFLMQTEKDPLMCAKQYGEDAKSAGVDVRVVIYQGGLHGFGLDSNPAFDVSHWPEEVQKWLNEVTISKKSE